MAFLLILIPLGVMALSLVFIYHARKNSRRARLIEESPAYRARDLVSGPGKMMGYAVALERPLYSPISDTPCVWYRFKVEERRSSGRSSHWATVIDDTQYVGCGIEDDTGVAEVELDSAEILLGRTIEISSGVWNDPPAELKGLLARRYNYSTEGWVFNKALRYTETLIEEGDRLFVVGCVDTLRRGKPRFVRGQELLLVSDRTEDALLSSYRWHATVFWILAVVAIILPLGLVSFIIGMSQGLL